ncbi:DUF58 domain-containing protein [Levilinea saccharolytica]|nr:DUF58 domain-containing protein [Levilinea saccharolytica]GAP16717.1 uncharacterized conserved protein [Levilinea saccharolytica]
MIPSLQSLADRWAHVPHPTCQAEVRLHQPWALFLAGAALLWYALELSPAAAVIFTLVGGMVLCAYLWARILAARLSGQRRLRYRAFQVGDTLEEEISLTNRSPLPAPWVEFSDRSDLPGYQISEVRAVSGGQTLRWSASTECRQRGIFRLGPWELRSGDPFGLFSVRQVTADPLEIVVYPPLAHLPPDLLRPRSAPGSQRPLRQPLSAETTQASTTRDYAPGDSLRRVHWPTTARREKWSVKEFDPEAAARVWLIVDSQAGVQREAEGRSSLEDLIITAASLSSHLLRSGLAVGILAAGNAPLPPRPGPHSLWVLLRGLAGLNAGPTSLGSALQAFQPLLLPQDLCVVLTPSLDPAWSRPLRLLAHPQAVLWAADPCPPEVQSARLRLTAQGIPTEILLSPQIRVIPAAYGALRRWEFRATGTGRVVVQARPREVQP